MTRHPARAALLWLALLCGCAGNAPLVVSRLSPTPHMDWIPSRQTLGFSLSPSIADAGVEPFEKSQLRYDQWRATLHQAFTNTFVGGFELIPEESAVKPEVTVSLLEARPMLTRTADGIVAQVKYRAELVGKTGESLKQAAGTAEADAVARDQLSDGLTRAVEAMYEQIAAQLFGVKRRGPGGAASDE